MLAISVKLHEEDKDEEVEIIEKYGDEEESGGGSSSARFGEKIRLVRELKRLDTILDNYSSYGKDRL